MEPPENTLGSILGDLVGDEAEREAYRANPEGFLAERGFADLPDRVVGEAVCQVADTLPAPVAEQLAPEVMALSPLTTDQSVATADDGGSGALAALANVPPLELADMSADIDRDIDVDFDGSPTGIDGESAQGAESDDGEGEPEGDIHAGAPEHDLDFGTGEGPAAQSAASDSQSSEAADAVDLEPELTDNGGIADPPGNVDDAASIDADALDAPGSPQAPVEEPSEPDIDWDVDLE